MSDCANTQILERTGLCDGKAVYCQGCMEASHRVNLQALNSCRERLEAALLQVGELQKKLAEEEAAHEKTMIERDGWEEALTQLAADAGCTEEWSNLHAHGDCITNLWDAKVKEAATSQKQMDQESKMGSEDDS